MLLKIPIQAWQQMHYYAKICAPNEVTGIGTIKANAERTELLVTEIFLPSQHTNPTYSQFDEGALNGIIYDLICQDPERSRELRFRWHSHGESPTFWSPTDLRDIESWESDWAVNLVINLRGDYLARLDIFEPLRVRNVELDLMIDYPDSPELFQRCMADVGRAIQRLPMPLMPNGASLLGRGEAK